MVGKEEVVDEETGEFRKVRYGDIVILLRSLSEWADLFAEVLNANGIRHIRFQEPDIFPH